MNPRKILGVDNNATNDEITRAYREKVQKHHPDFGGDAWAFQQVQEAYESLVVQESTETALPAARLNNQETETPSESWWHLFIRQLPLQNETTIFILVSVFDIFMTYTLLRFGAEEANPIANYFILRWGFWGMIGFKLAIVSFVCVIAQIVAIKKINTARFLLIVGTLLTCAVVVYSALLFSKHYT